MVAQHDAIAGAFAASKDGPPTVRFIWEKLDHFLDHVERGRRRRLAEEREARRAPERQRLPERTRAAPPAPMPDDVRLELEKLFGPRWTHGHAPR